MRSFLYGVLLLAAAYPVAAQDLYDENLADSMDLRVELWRQMDAYVDALPAVVSLESPGRYAATVETVRRQFAAGAGYKPFPAPARDGVRMEQIGEDAVATYYRRFTRVADGLEAYGLYLVPKEAARPAPLVIALHGGGGYPELATFAGGGNYHDMVRGAVAEGYVVYAPHMVQYPFRDRDRGTAIPTDVADQLEQKLSLRGQTLFALEAAKITAAVDALLDGPEVDAGRIAAIGLSRGGRMTEFLASLDTRIKVAVISGPPSLESPQLLCPRPVQVQIGSGDDVLGSRRVDSVKARAGKTLELYRRLGIADRFELEVFDGGHEFKGTLAWPFLRKHL